MTRLVVVVCNSLTLFGAPTKNCLLADIFSGPCGVTKYGSGWRKDVVNLYLEFAFESFALRPAVVLGHRPAAMSRPTLPALLSPGPP